jgi:hypothetical protein
MSEKVVQIEKYRRKRKPPEEVDELPEDVRDRSLGDNVISIVNRINQELPDESA